MTAQKQNEPKPFVHSNENHRRAMRAMVDRLKNNNFDLINIQCNISDITCNIMILSKNIQPPKKMVLFSPLRGGDNSPLRRLLALPTIF